MKTLTTSVHCDSPQCLVSGNAKRIFRVAYQEGAPQVHTIHCPYCHSEIKIELGGPVIWYIAPDSLLAA